MQDYYNYVNDYLSQQLNLLVFNAQGYSATALQQNQGQWPVPVLLVPTSPATSPMSTPGSSTLPRAILGRTTSSSSPGSSTSSWSSSSAGSPPSSTSYFPLNPSLEEDTQGGWGLIPYSENQEYSNDAFDRTTSLDEFRRMGKDYEYCPEDPDFLARRKAIQKYRRKNKGPLPTECVFCRNNDQPPSVYKRHILKNADGEVVCPILSKYICEYCGATGKNAHTRMYCSKRNNVEVPAPKSFQLSPRYSHSDRQSTF